jgi:hypothetical protein
MKQDASSVAPVASDDATENKQQQSDEAKWERNELACREFS